LGCNYWCIIYIRHNSSVYNRVRVLVDYLYLTYLNIPNVYMQIEIFETLKYFDQYIIQLMLRKIETLVFHATLTNENKGINEITCFNP